jgi:hypothetical protein
MCRLGELYAFTSKKFEIKNILVNKKNYSAF